MGAYFDLMGSAKTHTGMRVYLVQVCGYSLHDGLYPTTVLQFTLTIDRSIAVDAYLYDKLKGRAMILEIG